MFENDVDHIYHEWSDRIIICPDFDSEHGSSLILKGDIKNFNTKEKKNTIMFKIYRCVESTNCYGEEEIDAFIGETMIEGWSISNNLDFNEKKGIHPFYKFHKLWFTYFLKES